MPVRRAGGVGPGERSQHLPSAAVGAVSASLEGRVIEYVDRLHERLCDPVQLSGGHDLAPRGTGSFRTRPESLRAPRPPAGPVWQDAPAPAAAFAPGEVRA